MNRLILASKSIARKDLLKKTGIKFITAVSNVKEERIIKKSCKELVIFNALKKAKDVAKRFKFGVVIGADTVCLVNGKIIGKPKNIKDAAKTLKVLSKKPQWVYSGLAVIDIKTGKTLTAYEKTKVHMKRLSDKEIRGYFKKVSPMDKAGSFDIQGLGSVFIDKIEGCFYNVVGLPLAKLFDMLKKVDVNIF